MKTTKKKIAKKGIAWLLLLLPVAQASDAAQITKDFDSPAPPDHAMAQEVLNRALDNQYQGRFHADMELVRSSYLNGMQRLTGTIKVGDTPLDKWIYVGNDHEGFTYRSEGQGAEQWVINQNNQRIRRLANRQSKKSALGSVLSYEDLQRLPTDILREADGFKAFKQTDSTYEMSLSLGRETPSFYSRADAVITKSPVLVQSMVLYDNQGKLCKRVDIGPYDEIAGKFLLSRFAVTNSDSSACTWVAIHNPVLPDLKSLAKSDHAWSAAKPASVKPTLNTPAIQAPSDLESGPGNDGSQAVSDD